MWEWLLAPFDPDRLHLVSDAISWHGRLMVLAWTFMVPVAIGIARFAKVLPRQRWPQELDSQFWWRCHWVLQTVAALLCVVAFVLIWRAESGSGAAYHAWLGRALLLCMAVQVLSGVFRGSKGGPTAPAPDGSLTGDHYNMTARRRVFERWHKLIGYIAIAISIVAVVTGLWVANAPRWMWISVGGWWILLAWAFVRLQRAGLAVDTYQAIWGPDPTHPGNAERPLSWGVRRLGE